MTMLQVETPADGDCFFHALHVALNALNTEGCKSVSARALREYFFSSEALQEFRTKNKLTLHELMYIILIDCSPEEQKFIGVLTKSYASEGLSLALCAYTKRTPRVWASGGLIAVVSFHLKKRNITLKIVNEHPNIKLPKRTKNTVLLLYSGNHYEAIIW